VLTQTCCAVAVLLCARKAFSAKTDRTAWSRCWRFAGKGCTMVELPNVPAKVCLCFAIPKLWMESWSRLWVEGQNQPLSY
jgi:hypothetical protein